VREPVGQQLELFDQKDLQLIFATAHRELRPRTPLPEIKIEFFPFAGLNHTVRLHENRLMIRLSDIFTDAPHDVYRSLALILLAKLYRKTVDNTHHRTYRTFILTDDIQERARVARTQRCRQARARGARGKHVDLELLFDRLNEEYFGRSLDKPRLSWSVKRSRRVLGRYDATHNMIFISRLFDAPGIPSCVVAYVLFHEMLHIKYRSRVRDSRLMVHTPEFKAEEKKFREFEDAKRWLKTI
jgi:predicted metal-dependent hydrolase